MPQTRSRFGIAIDLRKLLLAAAACVGFIAQAGAETVSYYLDQSNIGGLPDGTPYLQVTISDGAAGAIDFSVSILQPLLDIADSQGFGLDSFAFNTGGGANAVTAANISGLPANWSVVTNNNQDGFGKFELIPQTNGAGNRISPTLTFSVTGVSGDTVHDYQVLSSGNAKDQGNQFFAAHVGGFQATGDTSAYFGGSTAAPVPLPAAVWLLGSALLCFGAIGQRRGAAI